MPHLHQSTTGPDSVVHECAGRSEASLIRADRRRFVVGTRRRELALLRRFWMVWSRALRLVLIVAPGMVSDPGIFRHHGTAHQGVIVRASTSNTHTPRSECRRIHFATSL
jgi:hypothetical protein